MSYLLAIDAGTGSCRALLFTEKGEQVDRIYEISGDWVSITAPARLRWLARHRHEILTAARGMGMLSDWIGTRLCGVLATDCGMRMRWFRDVFCEAEIAIARERGIDPYAVMEESASPVPPGSGGVLAIMSNLMNAWRWVHATPSFLGSGLSDPARSGCGACVRALEEAAAYVTRGHPVNFAPEIWPLRKEHSNGAPTTGANRPRPLDHWPRMLAAGL